MELLRHASTLCIPDILSKIEGLLEVPKVCDHIGVIFAIIWQSSISLYPILAPSFRVFIAQDRFRGQG